jgi:hypothetical protein
MPKPAPNFALLIGKKDGKEGDSPDHAKDLGVDTGMTKERAEKSAVQDLMAALKMSDPAGVASALKDFCKLQDEDDEPEPDEPSPDEGAPPPDMEE